MTPTGPTVSGFYSMFLADAAYNWQRPPGAVRGDRWHRRSLLQRERQRWRRATRRGVGFSLGSRPAHDVSPRIRRSPIRHRICTGCFRPWQRPAPGDAIPVAPDYAVNNSASYAYGTSASISHGLTRRGTLSGSFDYQHTDFVEERPGPARYLVLRRACSVRARAVNRNASLRVGYHYRTGDFGYAHRRQRQDDRAWHRLRRRLRSPVVRHAPDDLRVRRWVFGHRSAGAADCSESVRTVSYGVRGDFIVWVSVQSDVGDSRQLRAGLAIYSRVGERRQYRRCQRNAYRPVYARRWIFPPASATRPARQPASGTLQRLTPIRASARVRQALTCDSWRSTPSICTTSTILVHGAVPLGVPPSMERNGVRVGLTLWLRGVAEIEECCQERSYTPEDILRCC